MIRTALLSLATAAGLALASGSANAQVYIGPTYNPYGFVPAPIVTTPPTTVVTPVGGYTTVPVYRSGYYYNPPGYYYPGTVYSRSYSPGTVYTGTTYYRYGPRGIRGWRW